MLAQLLSGLALTSPPTSVSILLFRREMFTLSNCIFFYFTGASPNSVWDLGRDFYFELLYNVGTDRTPEILEEGLTEFTP